IPRPAAPDEPAAYRLPARPPRPADRSVPGYSDTPARRQSGRHPFPGSGNRRTRVACPFGPWGWAAPHSTHSHSAGIAAGLGAHTTPRDATAGHGVDSPAIAPGPPPPPQVPQSRAPEWGPPPPGGRQRSTRPAAAAEAAPAAPAGEVAAVLGGSCQRPPCPYTQDVLTSPRPHCDPRPACPCGSPRPPA